MWTLEEDAAEKNEDSSMKIGGGCCHNVDGQDVGRIGAVYRWYVT